MRYELMISLRYMFSKKRKRFISFMSLVSILGVAVGVSCLITVLAVMNGFGEELQKRIIGSNPHLIAEKEDGINIEDYNSISERIRKIGHIKGSYPFIWGQGVLKFRSRTQGVVIRSMDINNNTDFSKISEYIQTGEVKLAGNSIVIGSELSSTLGAFVGDELAIITSLSGKPVKFKITGVFTSGMYEYDLNMAYIGLTAASDLFGMGNTISGIGIDIDKIDEAVCVKEELRQLLPASYYVRTWIDMNRNLFSALRLEKWAMFIILTLIIVVAALNIVSTLTVMVTQKAKDIGILKAIGATRKIIMTVFSLHGLMIGLLGALIGALGGIGLSLVIKRYHFPILPGDIYYGINYLPVRMNIIDSFIIIASAIIISLAASLYPAYQASRLNPVDALRYE